MLSADLSISKKSVRPDTDEEFLIKTVIGLWIDRRKAAIVKIKDKEDEMKEIIFHIEKHVSYGNSKTDTDEESDLNMSRVL